MCLDRTARKPFKMEKESGELIGYKRFYEAGKFIYPLLCGDGPYELGKWVNEKDMRSNDSNSQDRDSIPYGKNLLTYPKGFHVYLENGPNRRKVYLRKPVAYGWQGSKKVVIAKEIFIPC